MPPESELPIGTLYISHQTLQHDSREVQSAISAALTLLSKYKGLDAYLRPHPERAGDYALILADHKIDPVVVAFIGVRGRGMSTIVEDLFVK